MFKRNYRMTFTAKILILQVILFSIGTIYGLVWKAYTDNRKWDNLIYYGVKVNGLHLNSRSIKEDEKLIEVQYIEPLMKEKISIQANGKIYTLKNSKLIKNYYIENKFDSQVGTEKGKLTLSERDKILKKGFSKLYDVVFIYDQTYMENVIGTIRSNVDKKPVDASIKTLNNWKIGINPDIKGYKLQKDKLEDEIKSRINSKNIHNVKIIAPVVEYGAYIDKNKLSLVNANIAHFSTNFSSSSYERAHNIELSSKLINDKLVMPGEIFSFNYCVGQRTRNRGFMEAPVIVGDKIDSGLGGGICQVSSTLYNAILRAGLVPAERAHHTIPPSYVGIGLDATVDWNNIDFKFRNTLKYPIYIESHTENGNIHINIYSNSNLLDRKYIVSNNIYEEIPPGTKVVNGFDIPEGESVIVQQGRNGYRSRVTRDIYENEKLVASEVISDDLYMAVPGVTKLGASISK
ncbi:MAG: VanW family protein [Clostridium sp.]|uniref:VanW family protein n=1 Tax=Clostridium sp. TaxID=1506 RepID=UPI0025BC4B9C|nr:VanW family protein [Clostridium sp.]MCH3964112.1 VanW family protein [Clostridium sp.]MCI1716313.1 VanW family protein [Clostridium sp.]MCI1800447.1 VanW family protein [Clostridium sp.]MCI1814490.1 VanW family protein [Clostridium sp.]MCI1871389.1 VanW family protein [Clostridium sp.]